MKRTMTVLAACMLSGAASASLVYNNAVNISAQGFGNAPRDLTIQATGNVTTESGCIAPTIVNNTITPIFGSSACTPDAFVSAATHGLSNGVSDTGGDEPNPHALNQKFDLPTFGSLGITSASDVAILFNATEPGGNSAFVNDLTLTVFSPTGARLFAIDGSYDFANTVPGNGSAGFVFTVDLAQQRLLAPYIVPGNIIGLGAALSGTFAGPESFTVLNLGLPPTRRDVPEPASLALLAIAGCAAAAIRRRSVRKPAQERPVG
jgi:hypothetical protein